MEKTDREILSNPEKPLVVHVVRQFYPNRGGLEDVVANLSHELLHRGFRVRVVTLDRLFTDPERILPKAEMYKGVEIVRIPWRGSSRYPVAPQVFRHLADADIVHVHAIDFFFDALAVGSVLHKKPMIVTTHGGFFHTARYATIKKIWFRTLTRLSALAYRKIVGCSRSDTALFNSIAPTRTVLIENGADTGKFQACSHPVAVRRIATIGRFSVNKRIDRLLDALKVLVARDPAWGLDIIGVPGDLTLADIEAMIADRGLGDHVHIHCNLENQAIAVLLREASLFASASEYEGFGLVAVEAMSAGLLPVLHGNDAYRLLAERHRNLVISDFTNPEGAAQAIEAGFAALAADPGLRDGLIAEAAEYSWNRVTDRYQSVYEDIIGKKVGSGEVRT